jgi:hypothetical protein
LTATSDTLTGLTNGKTYYFEVTAVNADGEGAPSNETNATPPVPTTPGAPGSLSATPGDSEVSLSWAPSCSSGNTAVTGYHVYVSTTAGSQGTVTLTTTASTTATVTGLSNGVPYYFEVTAVNAAGDGPPSAQVAATPEGPSPPPPAPPVTLPPSAVPPGPPSGLSATPGSSEVSLSWAAPSSNGGLPVSGYDVYLSTTPGSRGPRVATVQATAYTLTGLSNGTRYYFEVTAANGAGEGAPSAQVSATPVVLAPRPPPASPQLHTTLGYRLATVDGKVFAFGKVVSYSSSPTSSPVVGIASTPDGHGYWLALRDGRVVRNGDARLYGSMGGRRLASPLAGLAATPDGRGYWLVSSNGGVFAFGDARSYGSLRAARLGRLATVVGTAATPDGRGYWLVSSNGGVFAFGDAPFLGSLLGKSLSEKVVGIAAWPSGGP